MSGSNELNFGLPLDEQIESTSEETLGLGITEPTENDEKKIKGLSKEEYDDPNQIRVTIADPKAPLVVLFGPPACGKTMTLVRLARFLNKRGYKISPIRTFRSNDDQNYVEICKPENFSKIINSPDAANSTANVSFMLVEVIKNHDGQIVTAQAQCGQADDHTEHRRHRRAVLDEADKGEGHPVVVELARPHDARQRPRGGEKGTQIGADDSRV